MEKGKIPVLFVFAIQNYERYVGFRLNNLNYSKHPYEKEILLQEGFRVYVLDDWKTDLELVRYK